MREQHESRWGAANWITGGVMLLAYLAVSLLAPEMNNRWKLLIALAAGIVTSVVIYLIRKKKQEKEEEEKLPPV
ncbi:MAG: hypothetical protein IJK35_00215 [Oscillospiraceae bacterium]|nr:hypothetical protein [Oscillospiraceae bacterium]